MAVPDGCTNSAVDDGSSFGTVGTATNFDTVTTNSAPFPIALRGVITSSKPSRRHCAGAPLTTTPPTLRPAKSRLKRLSACVARARIVTLPSTGSVNALP